MEGAQSNNLNLGLRSSDLSDSEHQAAVISTDQTQQHLGFYKYIKQRHGYKAENILKLWTETKRKLAEAESRKKFLLACRRNDTLPNHIRNSCKDISQFHFYSKSGRLSLKKFIHSQNLKLLKLIIEDIHIHIFSLNKTLEKLRAEITCFNIDENTLNNFFKFTDNKANRIFENINERHEKKLSSLLNISDLTAQHVNNQDGEWIKNLSSVVIPEEVVDIVSLGPKFNVQQKLTKKDVFTTIKNLESKLDISNLNEPVKNTIRSVICKNLDYNFKTSFHSTKEEKLTLEKIKTTKLFIRNNPNIFFTRADKGNITVCLDTTSYLDKMSQLLGNDNTYELVVSNPLSNLQKDVYAKLQFLNNNNHLWKKFNNNRLTQTHTVLAKAYGLPKIHKDNYPLRPIISTINSPTHFLAKIIYEDLKLGIETPKSHINNSFDLIEKLKNLKIPSDSEYALCSIDACSLFTCIPCNEVLNSIDRRYNKITSRCKIPFENIRDNIKFLFNNTYFMFDNKIYKQNFGTPMGSPISPLFADIVMDDLETDVFNDLRENHNCTPIIYVRYVDDSFFIAKREQIDLIFEKFNAKNPNLKFTRELEINNRINFLDLTIIKNNDSLITNWYRKPTCSGRILSFKSNHSIKVKKNIIYNLIDRAILLSEKSFHNENLYIVRQVLQKNEYPTQFIDQCIKTRLRYIEFSNTHVQTNINNTRHITFTVSLPYDKKFFNKCSSMLKKFGIRTVPTYSHALKHGIIKLGKDKEEKFNKTGVVYKFSCNTCQASYVGQTKRALGIRIKEHKKSKGEVVDRHTHNNNHCFDWDKTYILDTEHNWSKRMVSEMIHIQLSSNVINKQRDTEKLSHEYKRILSRL